MNKNFTYYQVLSDITNQSKPNRSKIVTQKNFPLQSTFTSNVSDFPEFNYQTPNAGHNATVNSYVFDPFLTTLKHEEKKSKFEFENIPIVDETNLNENEDENYLSKNGENLIDDLENNLNFLKESNKKFKQNNKLNVKEKPNYITEQEIEEKKENILKDFDETNNNFLEKKRKDKENLINYLQLNENEKNIEFLNNINNLSETEANQKIYEILYNENQLKNKRIEQMKILSLKNLKKHGVFRKGYSNHKPIDLRDEKFIKKYARYLFFKKIKDDLLKTDDDDYEREYAKYIFTANSENSPRSLSLNNNENNYNNKTKNKNKNKKLSYDLSTLRNNNNYNNLSSFVAFIKMIFNMLNKNRKGKVSKEEIINNMILEDKILQDLGFNDYEDFKNTLIEFVPENDDFNNNETNNDNLDPNNNDNTNNNNFLSENDFIRFLLIKSDLSSEVNSYLNTLNNYNSNFNKIKPKKRKKRRGSNNEDSSSIELSETNSSSDDLPGLRTHVYDFLLLENDKKKLDALNVILENRSKNLYLPKNQKTKIKLTTPKMKISYHEYLTFLRRFHTKDEINFTIPKPFEFLKRDYQSKKLQKIFEILSERVGIEDYYINYKIRANKLKPGIWGNQLGNIIETEKANRLKRQEKLKEKIIAEMKPFSFYDEDERKYKEKISNEPIAPNFPPFRANAIKWLSQVNIYNDMIRKEKEERENRIRERMQKTFNASKLPPRMHMHMLELKKKEEEEKLYGKKNYNKNFDKKSQFHAKKIPDFKRLQNEFETKLDEMKKAAVPTVPEPFTFHEPKKKIPLYNFFDNENDPNYKNPVLKKSNINEVIKKMKRKPKIEPKSTKSLDLLMEVRRKEIEERERKVEEKMLEDLLRKERQDRLKERVQNSKAIIDNKKQLEENRRKLQEDFMNNLQKNKESYQNELQRRLEKVYAAPLMLEQIGSGKGEKFTMNKNTKDDLNELLADQEDNDGMMDENENQDENVQVEADDEYDEANEEKENEE